MSILLESLSKSSAGENSEVPDIHQTHYDDELMGDDWLLRRIRVWQWLTLLLLVALIGSWWYFLQARQATSPEDGAVYQSESVAANKNTSSAGEKQNSSAAKKQSSPTQDAAQKQTAQTSTQEQSLDRQASSQNDSGHQQDTLVKQEYKPIKRVSETQSGNAVTNPAKESLGASQSTSSSKTTTKETKTAASPALLVEELSADMQAEFPALNINSYVVADSADKSFVILDGDFYKTNQVIMPDLVLREISKQEIVVEFKGQKVKIPHN